MSSDARLIYVSSNSDRWFLVETSDRGTLVRHEPNQSSGGAVSERTIDMFLASGHGPEHAALHELLAAEAGGARPKLLSMLSPAQMRAGRGLLGWTTERLALEANLSEDVIAACETPRDLAPGSFETLSRIAQTLERFGVVMIGEGEVSAGGPGVRMGALGTSTGYPVESKEADSNDNVQQGEAESSAAGGSASAN
jgi:hypothetical protein